MCFAYRALTLPLCATSTGCRERVVNWLPLCFGEFVLGQGCNTCHNQSSLLLKGSFLFKRLSIGPASLHLARYKPVLGNERLWIAQNAHLPPTKARVSLRRKQI